MQRLIRLAGLALGTACGLAAGGPANVLVVVNEASQLSRQIGEYYAVKRAIPSRNVCRIRTAPVETIERSVYDQEIAAPIAAFLRKSSLTEQILYIVMTAGTPLRIDGSGGRNGEFASVDSELTLLYNDMKTGKPHSLPGPLSNPFYGRRGAAFDHPQVPIYMVTRLAAYDLAGARALVDRALQAKDRGKFVLDLSSEDDVAGNDWLRTAALLLPKERVLLEESRTVVQGEKDVIGYASWGSNDSSRRERFLRFGWLPGAIVTEYVSTNGRTFTRPPDSWRLGTWQDRKLWFANSPQSLTADYVLEGATGASGHVYEPYLTFTPRPDYLFPAYLRGRNLAESYYGAIPALSWQNIVVGDPLCVLGR